MRTLLVAVAVLLTVPSVAEGKRKKSASTVAVSAKQKQLAEHRKAQAEADRAEAELKEVRSGQLKQEPEERLWDTQQSDDAEKPPVARR